MFVSALNHARQENSNEDCESFDALISDVQVALSAQSQLLVHRITDQILLGSHDIDDRFKAQTLQVNSL